MAKYQVVTASDEHYAQAWAVLNERHVHPAVAVQLLPLLVSGSSTDYESAMNLAASFEGMANEDISSPRYASDLAQGVQLAKNLVRACGLKPVPANIAAEYDPSEDAINAELDRRTGRPTTRNTTKGAAENGLKAHSATAQRAARQMSLGTRPGSREIDMSGLRQLHDDLIDLSNEYPEYPDLPPLFPVRVYRLCNDGRYRLDERY